MFRPLVWPSLGRWYEGPKVKWWYNYWSYRTSPRNKMTIIKSQGVCLKYRVVGCVVNIPIQTLGCGITPETSVHVIYHTLKNGTLIATSYLLYFNLWFYHCTLYLGSVLSLQYVYHRSILIFCVAFQKTAICGRSLNKKNFCTSAHFVGINIILYTTSQVRMATILVSWRLNNE